MIRESAEIAGYYGGAFSLLIHLMGGELWLVAMAFCLMSPIAFFLVLGLVVHDGGVEEDVENTDKPVHIKVTRKKERGHTVLGNFDLSPAQIAAMKRTPINVKSWTDAKICTQRGFLPLRGTLTRLGMVRQEGRKYVLTDDFLRIK